MQKKKDSSETEIVPGVHFRPGLYDLECDIYFELSIYSIPLRFVL